MIKQDMMMEYYLNWEDNDVMKMMIMMIRTIAGRNGNLHTSKCRPYSV